MNDPRVRTEERGDVVVMTLGARADAGCDVLPVATAFMEQGRRRFLLNLSAVSQIDSAGLAQIVWTYLRVTQNGGALKLVQVSPRVRTLLDVTRLTPVFEAFESEDEALDSFPR